QGLAAGGRAHLAARLVQPRPLHLRRRSPLRPSGGGGVHPPARLAAAGICPAARRKRNVTVVGSGAASGGAQLLPEVLAFSSSLPLDRQLLREDVIGSMAHLIMLSRSGLVPGDAAAAIRSELVRVLEEAPQLPEEEDVHMAVETLLARKLGETAGMLHTARSRNDQVALDLRLHVREQAALALEELSLLLGELAERAGRERDTLLPGYTHRQRAQPVSAAYYF